MHQLLSLQTAKKLAEEGTLHGFYSMEEDDYHACDFAINQSSLKNMLVTPAHYLVELADRNETAAMVEGKAWHCQLFEPDKYQERFACSPKFDKRTKQGKADFESWASTNSTKIIIDEVVHENVTVGCETVRSRHEIKAFTSGGEPELVGFAKDPATGLLLRVKLDYYFPKTNIIIDFKKSAFAVTPRTFSATCVKYLYFFQAAFYWDVVELITGSPVQRYGIIAVENKPPYGSKVFLLSQRSVEFGRSQYRRCLEKLRLCKETQEWPCYESVIEEDFDAPDWAYREEDNWQMNSIF